jgi:hypothetical protein
VQNTFTHQLIVMQQTDIQGALKPAPTPTIQSSEAEFDRNFKPTGAIAFFLLLVLLGLIIWFGIYFLMLERV